MTSKLPDSLVELLKTFEGQRLVSLNNLFDLLNKQSIVLPSELEEVIRNSGIAGEDADDFAAQLMMTSEYYEKDSFIEAAMNEKLTDEVVDLFSKIAFSVKVKQIGKIAELSYHHPDVLIESNIIIDARPIFSEDHNTIHSFAILPFLKLRLSRHNEPSLLSIHMDRDDIQKLKKQCEKALNKIDVTSKELTSIKNQKVFVPGSE